jgi:transposase
LIRVTNDTRVSSDTMIDLLGRIAVQTPGPTTLVLDNARYQRCEAVKTEAKRLGIELLFRPSYSPNLNVIERLWKFTKKKALRGKHYPDFATFMGAIDDCLNRIHTNHREALTSLMTLKFQTFDNASFLAA